MMPQHACRCRCEEVARLREALAPFAQWAERIRLAGYPKPCHAMLYLDPGTTAEAGQPSVNDLYRAKAALEA